MNKISRRNFLKVGLTAGAALAIPWSVFAETPPPPNKIVPPHLLQRKVKPADRKIAADRLTKMGVKPGVADRPKAMDPGGEPHYYGPYANYANSPMPTGGIGSLILESGGSGYSATPTVTINDVYGTGSGADISASVVAGVITGFTIVAPGAGYTAPFVTISDATGSDALATAAIGGLLDGGIRKFVDDLPVIGTPTTTLGKYLQVGVAESVTYNAVESDYYEIALVEFDDVFHSDLPSTRLRGYVQLVTPGNPSDAPVALTYPDGSPIYMPDGVTQAMAMDTPRYLGPLLVAQRDRPIRIKFYNLLPTGSGGDLFIPVDETVMGAGEGLPGRG